MDSSPQQPSQFDPIADSRLRGRLLSMLGASPGARVEAMKGMRGGLNEGVWYLWDRGRGVDLVLKLVRSDRLEADAFLRLSAAHPEVASDPSLAFPVRIIRVCGANGQKVGDLVVMKRAPGVSLGDVLSDLAFGNRERALLRIFRNVGEVVGAFHRRYGGQQHGDLHTANIFYDEGSNFVTLIDLAGMGGRYQETDLQHFEKSLNLFSSSFPRLEEYRRQFMIGYAVDARLALPSRAMSVPALRGCREIPECLTSRKAVFDGVEDDDSQTYDDDDDPGEYPAWSFLPTSVLVDNIIKVFQVAAWGEPSMIDNEGCDRSKTTAAKWI